MTEEQDLSQERPLVTFAVFAYNQEKYIREAVEGAFSQTYEPLEIVLSDDCSSDRTFEIMQEMAAAYRGPHRIITRRSEVNLGTALHFSAVATLSKGELLIVAAGDDISLPKRSTQLTKRWMASNKQASLIHSTLIEFSNENSIEKEVKLIIKQNSIIDIKWYLKNKSLAALSPTCAYSKKIFAEFPDLIGGSIIEDGPLSFRSILKGGFAFVNEPLVRQRKLNETAGTGYKISNPNRWNRFIRSRMISYQTKIQDLSYVNTLSIRDKHNIEQYFIKSIINLSKLLIFEYKKYDFLMKMNIFVNLLIRYPSSHTFIDKFYFSIYFLEWSDLRIFEVIRIVFSNYRRKKLLVR